MIHQLASRVLLIIIKFYQKVISPVIPARCRYYPTCSEYGKTAIKWHGAKRGGWLTLKRICSCHPLGGHGVDFVPLPLYQLFYSSLSHQLKKQASCYQYKFKNVSCETYILERGIFKDCSSYSYFLNLKLKS